MNNEKAVAFDAFIEEYTEKPLLEKQKILIEELKELIVFAQKICEDRGIKSELLLNKELADVNKENYTQDDFVEAVYVYIQMYKEIIASYVMPDYEE